MKKQPTIKILVGYHKPALLFKSNILTPIHLGRAVAREASKDGSISDKDYHWMLDNMIGDDTGENISAKNRLYAELTALYWAWKNYEELGSPDYIGCMHYRRLLNFSGDEEDHSYKGLLDSVIKKEISGQDMIFSLPLGAWSQKSGKFIDQVYMQYSIEHHQKDLDLFCDVIRDNYPQMSDALNTVLFSSPKISWYGIFIMKKQLFFEYARFVFDVFNKLEKHIDWKLYPVDQQRVFGYFQEFLLNIYKEFKSNSTSLKTTYFPLYRVDNKIQRAAKLGIDIHVCLGFNDIYIPHAAATIASILKNANALDYYHFHILSSDLSRGNRRKLKKLNKVRSCSFNFHRIPRKWLSSFRNIKVPSYINLNANNRFFIPSLLPKVEKAIYLDSDTIVLKDLNEMASIDLGKNWFGGIEDVNAAKLAKSIHLPDSKYINSGVLIIETKKLRDNDYMKILRDTLEKNGENYYLCDQDLLNDAFHDRIMLISYRFNMFHKFHKLFTMFNPTYSEDFVESCNDPVIVHFVGPNKPWGVAQHPYKKIYDYYLSLTPWNESINFASAHIDLQETKFLNIATEAIKKIFSKLGKILARDNTSNNNPIKRQK